MLLSQARQRSQTPRGSDGSSRDSKSLWREKLRWWSKPFSPTHTLSEREVEPSMEDADFLASIQYVDQETRANEAQEMIQLGLGYFREYIQTEALRAWDRVAHHELEEFKSRRSHRAIDEKTLAYASARATFLGAIQESFVRNPEW